MCIRDRPGKVQLVKKSDLADGVFPETAADVAAEKESANEEGFFTNQAVIRGLESATEYAYRVGDGTASVSYTHLDVYKRQW